MRLGGVARFVLDIEKPEEISQAVEFAEERSLPIFILGRGANAIGRDEGYAGVILRNKILGIELLGEDDEGYTLVRAMGGEEWDSLVAFTTERGLSGIEAMSAIPSTVGAAPIQNIGAYGQDLSQVLENVEVYDIKTGDRKNLPAEELGMSYRQTIFNTGPDKGRYFIVAITIRLKTGRLKPPFYTSLQNYIDENRVTDFSPENIRKMVMEIRASKLPDPAKIPSAGSFFKNIYLSKSEAEEAEDNGILVWKKPGGKYMVNAGWLLDEAGLKGRKFHGMEVNEKAALVLINRSAKSYADLAAARAEIQEIIRDKFGFELEQEPVEII